MSQTKAQLVQPVGVFTGTGINISGVITATSFTGDGTGLTGVASTDNIITGTAATFNNIVHVNSTLTANSGFTTNAINTNLNVTGITTIASAKIPTGFTTNATNTNLTVTGITTLSDDVTFKGAAADVTWDKSTDDLIFNDNAQAKFGTGGDLSIYHNGTNSVVNNTGTRLIVTSDDIWLKDKDDGDVHAKFIHDGGCELYYDNTKRLETGNGGVVIAGVCTATSYTGDGSALTGVGESIAPWYYNPEVSETSAEEVTTDTGIGITFNKKIVAGSGTATLKIVNAGTAGTTVQSWGISSATFATTVFSLGALVSDLDTGKTYQVDIPATFIDDAGGKSYVGTAWTFATQEAAGGEVLVASNAWVWGRNSEGTLGLNSATSADVESPVQLPGTTWANLGRATYYAEHYSMVKSNNTLWVWGKNNQGMLGQNNTTRYSSPVQVPGTNWGGCATGMDFMMAYKTDGTLWSWGNNQYGQLGHNNTTQYSSPKQIPGTWAYTNAGVIACGTNHSIAIGGNGKVYCWGTGSSGQLAQSPASPSTQYSSPVAVGSATNWKFVAADVEKSLSINTSGELWQWGKNQHGQIGMTGAFKYQSSPIQTPGTWTSACFGDDQGAGIRSNGTLFCWGNNNYGQCGQNSVSPGISSPIQVPGTTWSTNHMAIASGSNHILAMKSDGTAWAWGYGGFGNLAQSNKTNYSSPVQVHSNNDNIRQVDGTDHGSFLLDT